MRHPRQRRVALLPWSAGRNAASACTERTCFSVVLLRHRTTGVLNRAPLVPVDARTTRCESRLPVSVLLCFRANSPPCFVLRSPLSPSLCFAPVVRARAFWQRAREGGTAAVAPRRSRHPSTPSCLWMSLVRRQIAILLTPRPHCAPLKRSARPLSALLSTRRRTKLHRTRTGVHSPFAPPTPTQDDLATPGHRRRHSCDRTAGGFGSGAFSAGSADAAQSRVGPLLVSDPCRCSDVSHVVVGSPSTARCGDDTAG